MQKNSRSLSHLTNEQLIVEVKALAAGERHATARLITSLAELDVRKLYLGEGYSSLFSYCTHCLHLSEHAAYNRIEAARASRTWPMILDLLADGSLTLTTACLLAPHLTDDNHRGVLDSARWKSKRDVEQLVAALQPLPDVPSVIRKLPAPKAPALPIQAVKATASDAPVEAASLPLLVSPRILPLETLPAVATVVAPTPPRTTLVMPLAPERYKVQVTVSRETHDKLRRAQDLLRHSVPDGDPAEIFDRALTSLVAHLEKTKLASARRPGVARVPVPSSRHIPSAVKRAVWHRDAARCAFVGTEGRCAERGFLEFHHVMPYADGGAATEKNIQLRCRAHNPFEAEEVFGSGGLFSESCRGV